jgi:hypothetical protein
VAHQQVNHGGPSERPGHFLAKGREAAD